MEYWKNWNWKILSALSKHVEQSWPKSDSGGRVDLQCKKTIQFNLRLILITPVSLSTFNVFCR